MREDIREDIRGYCDRNCIFSDDDGRCDVWDDIEMPIDINKCRDYMSYDELKQNNR